MRKAEYGKGELEYGRVLYGVMGGFYMGEWEKIGKTVLFYDKAILEHQTAVIWSKA